MGHTAERMLYEARKGKPDGGWGSGVGDGKNFSLLTPTPDPIPPLSSCAFARLRRDIYGGTRASGCAFAIDSDAHTSFSRGSAVRSVGYSVGHAKLCDDVIISALQLFQPAYRIEDAARNG